MKQVLFAVLFAASSVLAEETEEAEGAAEEASSDVAAVLGVAQPAKETPKASFTTLPLCRRVEGPVFVRLFGTSEWTPAEEGHFYPLGTSFRTEEAGRLTVTFSKDSSASIAGDAEFGTRPQPLGVPSRTVVLARGKLDLKLANNMPEGAFIVASPGFVVKNPAGESCFVYEDMGDGDKVTISCRTGTLGIEGRHFEIPAMRSACTIIIRTSRDMLSTILYGKRGDCTVKIDKNVRIREEIGDDGTMKQIEEHGFADFRLSTSTKIVINRSVPAIGERMSAFIMAFDASGERTGEGIVVCEGRAEINGGELVRKEKLNGAELAKQAAAATETTEAPATEEEKPTDEKSEEPSSDNNEM